MKTVKQLLHAKGHKIASIGPEESVFDAMQLMAANNIGALLVMSRRQAGRHSDRTGFLAQILSVGQTGQGYAGQGNHDASGCLCWSERYQRRLHGLDHGDAGASSAGCR